MKKKAFATIIACLILFVGTSVYAEPNLEGLWDVNLTCVGVSSSSPPYPTESLTFEIYEQDGDLFKLIVVTDPASNECYGAIAGWKIHVVCWDSITDGWLIGKKRIKFVSRNQQDNPPTSPQMCKGEAVKQ